MAAELLRTLDSASVCHMLAERIYSVAEGALVAVSEFDPTSRTVTLRRVACTPAERERLVAIFGREPEGLTLRLPDEMRQRWTAGELAPVPSLYEMLFGQVPAAVCERVVSELGIGSIFGMACTYEDDILGTVAVARRGRGRARRRRLIESFVSLAALALKRIRAEVVQEQTERRYRLLYENTSDGVWLQDRSAVIVEVNDAYCRLSGYTRDEIVGMPVSALEAVESPAEIAEHVKKVLESGHDRFESRHRRKDGSLFDVDITALHLEGVGSRIAIFVRDITDRKRIETALRDADRRKDEFLAVLSHELRGSLAPIRNSIYLLQNSPPGGESARRALEVIERQSGHLSRLVDDLLDLNRISRGKTELRRQRLDVAEVVRFTAEDHRTAFDEKAVGLEIDVARTPLWLDADPTRIAQVIGNLLGNALKFTPRDGKVRMSVNREGAEVVVRVHDTGAGIEPELLERIFDPFTQAAQSLARGEGGLGLGLALVKGFVEMHGGTVSAVSAGPGRGTEFVVRLPLLEPSAT